MLQYQTAKHKFVLLTFYNCNFFESVWSHTFSGSKTRVIWRKGVAMHELLASLLLFLHVIVSGLLSYQIWKLIWLQLYLQELMLCHQLEFNLCSIRLIVKPSKFLIVSYFYLASISAVIRNKNLESGHPCLLNGPSYVNKKLSAAITLYAWKHKLKRKP